MPFFSIIIPTYNRAHFLPKAIESVIAQSFADWELIIVDDGSTDNTKEVVLAYTDDRIRYIYQENAERSAARNNGIHHSQGEYICFLDSDDYYLQNHLESFYELLENKDFPKCFIITNIISEINGSRKNINIHFKGEGRLEFFFKNLITPNMVCLHKEVFKSNLFLEKFKFAYWEDTHLWIRIALTNTIFYKDDYTSVQVEHDARSINVVSRAKLKKRYSDHLKMVKHLFLTNGKNLSQKLPKGFKREYLANRHKMFLYISRINKYLFYSIYIWFNAIINKPDLYLLKEFPLIFLNKINYKKD